LQRLAAGTGREVAQVRQFYEENQLLGVLRRQLEDEKTVKFLVDHAQIDPVPENETQEK
jgi:hypothetical protein